MRRLGDPTAANAAEDRTTSLRRESERLAVSLLQLARTVGRAEHLSVGQLLILRALVRSGPLPATRLVRWTDAPPSTITGMLDGLVHLGLVRREHGSEDRRQVLVSLTGAGRRTAGRLEERFRRYWDPIEEQVRRNRGTAVVPLLADLSSRLDEAVHPTSGAPLSRPPTPIPRWTAGRPVLGVSV
jgi:DNA-binding MarR family transcriptional regulator